MVGEVEIEKMISCEGHASVSTRKGNKKVCLYELEVKLSWTGKPVESDGKPTIGEIVIGEFATENDEDEFTWKVTSTTKGSGDVRAFEVRAPPRPDCAVESRTIDQT